MHTAQPNEILGLLLSIYAGRSCVVLGGSGQLGSYLCETLQRAQARVLSISRRGNECVDNFTCDLARSWPAACDAVMRFGPDYIFGLAAVVQGITGNEINHYGMCMQNAELGIAQARIAETVPFARYVYCSTVCVYSSQIMTEAHEEQGYWGLPEQSNRGYGEAKRFVERLILMGVANGRRWLIVRPSNLYSERESFDDEFAHVIPRLAARILGGENPLRVRGRGLAKRTFLHARDCAEAMLLAAWTDHDGPLNLPASHEDEVSISQLVDLLCALSGIKPVIEWLDGYEGYPRRLSSFALLDRIFRDTYGFRWRPAIRLTSGLTSVLQAARDAAGK